MIKEKIEEIKGQVKPCDLPMFLLKINDNAKQNSNGVLKHLSVTQGIIDSVKKIEGLFKECIFDNIHFKGIDLSKTTMGTCIFINCSFVDCKGNVEFLNCDFNNVKFTKCKFAKSGYVRCEFNNTMFSDTDIRNANFSLSNYKNLYCERSQTENTLLEAIDEEASNDNKDLLNELIQQRFMYIKIALQMLYVGDAVEKDSDLDKELKKLKQECDKINEKLIDDPYKKMTQDDLEYELIKHDQEVDKPIYTGQSKSLDLSGYDFTGMNFQEHNLTGINFSSCKLDHACLAGCICTDCDFSNTSMIGTILFGTRMLRNKYDGTKMDKLVIDNKNKKIFVEAGLLNTDRDINLMDESEI